MTKVPFSPRPSAGPRSQRGAALPWVFFGFIAVAGFFFFTEHRAHLMGALPFVLLALCPLMHLFHHGHGGHGHHGAGGHEGRGAAGPGGGSGDQGHPGSPSPAPTAPRSPHQH